ncbi:hypothetical protein HYV43_02995 [Candidatus Micrarchaeota archaeon]|nr:hypothetical protein [Candidatus Micrarchaeota archaeon]
MKKTLLFITLAAMLIFGCTSYRPDSSQINPTSTNWPSPKPTHAPTASPAMPSSSPAPSATVVSCVPEGGLISDAIIPNEPVLRCCPGLKQVPSEGREGATCVKTDEMPTPSVTPAPSDPAVANYCKDSSELVQVSVKRCNLNGRLVYSVSQSLTEVIMEGGWGTTYYESNGTKIGSFGDPGARYANGSSANQDNAFFKFISGLASTCDQDNLCPTPTHPPIPAALTAVCQTDSGVRVDLYACQPENGIPIYAAHYYKAFGSGWGANGVRFFYANGSTRMESMSGPVSEAFQEYQRDAHCRYPDLCPPAPAATSEPGQPNP